MHQHSHAYCRAQRARIKRKVSAYYNFGEPKTARVLGMLCKTRQFCSGMCCGNQRRWAGITNQERRALDSFLSSTE